MTERLRPLSLIRAEEEHSVDEGGTAGTFTSFTQTPKQLEGDRMDAFHMQKYHHQTSNLNPSADRSSFFIT